MLENSQKYVCSKVKTVKCEIINVEMSQRDLPLNNPAIMVKWKCLKSLYSPKGVCLD